MSNGQDVPRGSSRRSLPTPDFQVLFEQAPALFLILTPDFRIVAVSNEYLAATKTTREAILGLNIFDVFPDNPQDIGATGQTNLRASLQRVVQTGEPDTMAVQKYDIRRPESEGGGFEERFWSPTNSPIKDASGAVIYIAHRAKDVTEFVRLRTANSETSQEARVFRSRMELAEAEVLQRAQEVQEANKRLRSVNDELAQLYEKTRQLDQLKTQFFSNVSHELRTPLTLILGPVHKLLASPDLPPAARASLELVERNAAMLHSHVSDLLDLTKLDARAMQVRYVAVDLAQLARVTCSHFESLAADHEVTYRIVAPETLPAQIDRDKVRRVLLNLLSNAFKHTPRGGAITVELTRELDTAVLTVSDTGPGIPPDQRQAIFNRFYQMKDDVRSGAGGVGLGLSIVKEFVELHGGSVSVGGVPGAGASFTVRLPLLAPRDVLVAKEQAEPEAPEASTSVARAIATARDEIDPNARVQVEIGPMTDVRPLILIVEDNSDMRQFLRESLQSDWRVLLAPDGREGLRLAREAKPEIIISDIMMPHMTGVELFKHLRHDRILSEIPVVFLTAKADEELRLELLENGVHEFISKPFAPRELRARVARLVHDRARARERFRVIVEAAPTAILAFSESGRCVSANGQAERLFGYSRPELSDRKLTELLTDESAAIWRGRPTRPPVGEPEPPAHLSNLVGKRSDGSLFPMELTASTVATEDGPLTLVAVLDVTERRRSERRQAMMMAELDHRVKNNLSVVISLASQTMRSSASMKDFEDAFLGRIRAMAHMHSALAESKWEGMSIRELVTMALQSYCATGGAQTSFEGPDVVIPGRLGQALCLALHELGTNAAKYGALSSPSGHVDVTWNLHQETDGDHLTLSWKESNGPRVAKPAKLGFGAVLIRDGLAYELGATAELEFKPTGVECQIDAPLGAKGEQDQARLTRQLGEA